MEATCPLTPLNETENISDSDVEGTAENFYASPQMPLHLQEHQPQLPPEVPLTPLALYPPQPRDESEARESFRRGAIEKAHEISALSWVEHIQNHDVHRFRNSIQRRPRSNSVPEQYPSERLSLVPSEGAPTISEAEDWQIAPSFRSFHSVTARSTLRRRRTSSYGDLGLAFPPATDDSAVTPSIAPIVSSFKRYKRSISLDDGKVDKEIGIVARPASFETDIKIPKRSQVVAPQPAATRVSTHRGEESSPVRKNRIEGLATWEKYYNRHVQLMISLALFSYLGQFSRYFIEHIFGKACHKPETVGWDPIWSMCTSSPGTTESTGGAFFTDLPTNIIGCFLMGLLVSGDGESISVNLPMAGLPRHHFFQNWVVTHVGLRTGFCGALTTFASWNTQMVVMICGGRATDLGYSQWMSAIWGYVLGFYASLQSYQFGVAVAYALSRWYNPHLAREADRIVDKKAIGVLIHRDLPDFERRFLHDIVFENQHHQDASNDDSLLKYGKCSYEAYYDNHIHHLRAWKETTDSHRHGFRGGFENVKKSYVSDLHEIEKTILVHRMEPRQELLEIARDAGWDVGALRNWISALTREEQRIQIEGREKSVTTKNNNRGEHKSNTEFEGDSVDSVAETQIEDSYFATSYSSIIEVVITFLGFLVATGLLLTGFFHYSSMMEFNDDDRSVLASSYRTQFLASLVSPLGTYARWHLSRLNGTVRDENWEWLPIGTLWANLIASCISALCAGILLSLEDGSLEAAFVVATQVGFAGSCSTVSTYCTETAGLLRALPRAFWGYYYGFGSMICALAVGTISYVWAVL
uniref:Fluoride ion transporter CrcB n=1 Tax=Pseudo-nitzschia delicatissima TaxID=44447 RepID=A0A6T9ZMC4_9STRA|mmetsp:Transcript_174/g.404  ORF Transcript_174/g.404 Transcript_174/m.404 type:complete len:811 (+) Transcript_174:87-2519(+)